MPSSDSDGQAPPRKRSRTNVNGEDNGPGGKKARGRPRVDTQDETAADRRRTQIRLAQRAYRQRKETTISSLKDQNTRLQSIIEQMNKSFLQFNDAALKSGLLQLNPSLAQQLKNVTESFVTLAKSASESKFDGEEEAGDAIVDGTVETQNPASTESSSGQYQPQPQHMDIGLGYYTSIEQSGRPHVVESPVQESQRHHGFFSSMPDYPSDKAKDSSVVRYRNPVSVGRLLDQGVSWSQTRSDERESSQQLPFGLIDILSQQNYSPPHNQNPHVYSVSIPTPEVTPPLTRIPTPPQLPSLTTRSLKPIFTYSHDETTFARRLTRAALETGFHLLSASNQRPAALKNVFRLSLPWMSLNDLRERFKTLLSRGTDEELDCWDTPFIHLGGAGTHYPRKDAKGNVKAIPNSWTVRRIGPISSQMIRAEHSTDPSQSHDLNIDMTGMEGEWFDAYDVEGYLEQEKGVRINPKASFAEVFVDDDERNEDYLSLNQGSNSDYSDPRRSSDESDTPSFGTSPSSVDTASSTTTPTNNVSAGISIDDLLGQPDAPFGLDMPINMSSNFPPADFTKFPDLDPSSFFDQPLGLDLAPGFDMSLNPNTSSLPPVNYINDSVDMGALGLDMMNAGGADISAELPVVKQKKKKAAHVDVTKLIEQLISHGVCLGRAPGFRRKDVDMAFQQSLIAAC